MLKYKASNRNPALGGLGGGKGVECFLLGRELGSSQCYQRFFHEKDYYWHKECNHETV